MREYYSSSTFFSDFMWGGGGEGGVFLSDLRSRVDNIYYQLGVYDRGVREVSISINTNNNL